MHPDARGLRKVKPRALDPNRCSVRRTAMLVDALRLLFFPALMAFAASSDLFTMTISNRLSLALVGGFAVLTVFSGMTLPAIGLHLAAGTLVLVISFVL